MKFQLWKALGEKKKKASLNCYYLKNLGRWRNQTDSGSAVSTWPSMSWGLKRSVLYDQTCCDCCFKPSHGNKISTQHIYKSFVFQDVAILHYCSCGFQEAECRIHPAAEKWVQRETEKVTSNHAYFFGWWLWRWPGWQVRTLLLLGPDGFLLEPNLRSMLHELLAVGVQNTTRISFGLHPMIAAVCTYLRYGVFWNKMSQTSPTAYVSAWY